MSSSSSTESGCDGPCEVPIEDAKYNNPSTDKIFEDDHSDSAYIPVELYTNVSNGDSPNPGTDNQNTKNMSSNGLGIAPEKEKYDTNNVSTDDKCKNVMPDLIHGMIATQDKSMKEGPENDSNLSVERNKRNDVSSDVDSDELIQDIVKELDSPVSIYISNEEQSSIKGHKETKKENTSNSDMPTRKISGAKVDQIIKENSEMLEKMMKKRSSKITTSENHITLEKEELEAHNDIKEKSKNGEGKILDQKEHSDESSSEQTKPKTVNLRTKKTPVSSKTPAKHFPTVSTMSPVQPQFSKPQLSPVGGMVVQQRSDAGRTGQSSTKPITFNPFPNSSRIGHRKSNEVGRKLGLYPAPK